jgi:hypothetical protein
LKEAASVPVKIAVGAVAATRNVSKLTSHALMRFQLVKARLTKITNNS